MDPESRSSNNLAKVLLKNYWKINPKQIINAPDYANFTGIKTAFVQIGDRTFGKKNQYKFVYDLAETWQKMTGLPFVFAAWVANKPLSPEFMKQFNAALKSGLDAREELLKTLPVYPDFDLRDYLFNKLQFDLTEDKKTGFKPVSGLYQKIIGKNSISIFGRDHFLYMVIYRFNGAQILVNRFNI